MSVEYLGAFGDVKGKVVNENDALEYAIRHIKKDKQMSQDIVDYYFSDNWVVRDAERC